MHSCLVMCCDDSDMSVFTDTATWIWMKGKQPVLTWNMLIKEKHSTAPPHSVWSRALIKHTKKEHFYISNLLHFKSPTVCGLCLAQGWQTKDCTGRDDSSDNRVVRNSLSLETHHYWEYESIRAMLQPIKMWPWVSAVGTGYIWDIFCITCWIIGNVACDPELRWATCKNN